MSSNCSYDPRVTSVIAGDFHPFDSYHLSSAYHYFPPCFTTMDTPLVKICSELSCPKTG